MEHQSFNNGAIVSADLTVERTEEIRDFYQNVIGWTVEDMAMKDDDGSYNDYVMKDAEGKWVGGVCHHRGSNIGIPPQWITYVNVGDIGASVQRCKDLGGAVVKSLKTKLGIGSMLLYAIPPVLFLALPECHDRSGQHFNQISAV